MPAGHSPVHAAGCLHLDVLLGALFEQVAMHELGLREPLFQLLGGRLELGLLALLLEARALGVGGLRPPRVAVVDRRLHIAKVGQVVLEFAVADDRLAHARRR